MSGTPLIKCADEVVSLRSEWLAQAKVARATAQELPEVIRDLTVRGGSVDGDSHGGLSMTFLAPAYHTPEEEADAYAWVHQTMLLFQEVLGAVWQEKPTADGEKTIAYTGSFTYNDQKWTVRIISVPNMGTCKIVSRKEWYEQSRYEILCPEEVS